MADLDYYASYADVQDILMNAGLGLDGNTILDDEAIEKILKISQAKIHGKLLLRTLTSITNVVDVEILKEIQIDHIMQRILAARHANENNLSDISSLTAFWTMAPTFTFAQLGDLARIKRLNQSSKGAFNHDIRTGSRL